MAILHIATLPITIRHPNRLPWFYQFLLEISCSASRTGERSSQIRLGRRRASSFCIAGIDLGDPLCHPVLRMSHFDMPSLSLVVASTFLGLCLCRGHRRSIEMDCNARFGRGASRTSSVTCLHGSAVAKPPPEIRFGLAAIPECAKISGKTARIHLQDSKFANHTWKTRFSWTTQLVNHY